MASSCFGEPPFCQQMQPLPRDRSPLPRPSPQWNGPLSPAGYSTPAEYINPALLPGAATHRFSRNSDTQPTRDGPHLLHSPTLHGSASHRLAAPAHPSPRRMQHPGHVAPSSPTPYGSASHCMADPHAPYGSFVGSSVSPRYPFPPCLDSPIPHSPRTSTSDGINPAVEPFVSSPFQFHSAPFPHPEPRGESSSSQVSHPSRRVPSKGELSVPPLNVPSLSPKGSSVLLERRAQRQQQAQGAMSLRLPGASDGESLESPDSSWELGAPLTPGGGGGGGPLTPRGGNSSAQVMVYGGVPKSPVGDVSIPSWGSFEGKVPGDLQHVMLNSIDSPRRMPAAVAWADSPRRQGKAQGVDSPRKGSGAPFVPQVRDVHVAQPGPSPRGSGSPVYGRCRSMAQGDGALLSPGVPSNCTANPMVPRGMGQQGGFQGASLSPMARRCDSFSYGQANHTPAESAGTPRGELPLSGWIPQQAAPQHKRLTRLADSERRCSGSAPHSPCSSGLTSPRLGSSAGTSPQKGGVMKPKAHRRVASLQEEEGGLLTACPGDDGTSAQSSNCPPGMQGPQSAGAHRRVSSLGVEVEKGGMVCCTGDSGDVWENGEWGSSPVVPAMLASALGGPYGGEMSLESPCYGQGLVSGSAVERGHLVAMDLDAAPAMARAASSPSSSRYQSPLRARFPSNQPYIAEAVQISSVVLGFSEQKGNAGAWEYDDEESVIDADDVIDGILVVDDDVAEGSIGGAIAPHQQVALHGKVSAVSATSDAKKSTGKSEVMVQTDRKKEKEGSKEKEKGGKKGRASAEKASLGSPPKSSPLDEEDNLNRKASKSQASKDKDAKKSGKEDKSSSADAAEEKGPKRVTFAASPQKAAVPSGNVKAQTKEVPVKSSQKAPQDADSSAQAPLKSCLKSTAEPPTMNSAPTTKLRSKGRSSLDESAGKTGEVKEMKRRASFGGGPLNKSKTTKDSADNKATTPKKDPSKAKAGAPKGVKPDGPITVIGYFMKKDTKAKQAS